MIKEVPYLKLNQAQKGHVLHERLSLISDDEQGFYFFF